MGGRRRGRGSVDGRKSDYCSGSSDGRAHMPRTQSAVRSGKKKNDCSGCISFMYGVSKLGNVLSHSGYT